jgi:hypothetical protein
MSKEFSLSFEGYYAAYSNGCGWMVAPTYGAASPVIETARRRGDHIYWEIGIL